MSIRQNNKTLILASVIGLSSIGLSSISNAQAQSETIDSRFTMTGYGDVTYFDQEDGNSVFRSRFIPIFLYKLNDKIHIESEIEFGIGEEGETEATMEYADLHYFLTDNTTLTAGKFLLPFGQFGPNLHPSWINRLPSMPGIYGGHGGNGTLTPLLPIFSDVGIGLQHTFDFGEGGKLFADLYLVNGPKTEIHADEGHAEEEEEEEAGHGDEAEEGHGEEEEEHGAEEAASFPEIGFESTSSDNNDDKAFGGRLAYAFLPSLEIGYSFYKGAYDGNGDLDFTAQGLDFNYTGTYLTVRGEFVKTEAEQEEHEGEIKTVKRDGWYLQTSWQARQLQIDALNPVELVLRRTELNKIDEAERWTYGVNYWMNPNAALKLALEDTEHKGGEDDSRFLAQLTFGF